MPDVMATSGFDPDQLRLVLPIVTVNPLNTREHWTKKAERNTGHRQSIALLWPWQWRRRAWRFPMVVHLVRHAPGRPLDEGDNLAAALKSVRDELARLLGVDDGEVDRIRFTYGQEKGPYGVVVQLQEAA